MKKDMDWFREQLYLTKEEIKNSSLSADEKYSRLLGISFAIGLSKEVDLDGVTPTVDIEPDNNLIKELAFNINVYAPVEETYNEDDVHDKLISVLECNGYSSQVYKVEE